MPGLPALRGSCGGGGPGGRVVRPAGRLCCSTGTRAPRRTSRRGCGGSASRASRRPAAGGGRLAGPFLRGPASPGPARDSRAEPRSPIARARDSGRPFRLPRRAGGTGRLISTPGLSPGAPHWFHVASTSTASGSPRVTPLVRLVPVSSRSTRGSGSWCPGSGSAQWRPLVVGTSRSRRRGPSTLGGSGGPRCVCSARGGASSTSR